MLVLLHYHHHRENIGVRVDDCLVRIVERVDRDVLMLVECIHDHVDDAGQIQVDVVSILVRVYSEFLS